jgi:hypothetical protein
MLNTKLLATMLACVVTICGAKDLWAADPGYKNPHNLPLIGQVRAAGSDSRSRKFQKNVLPAFLSFIDKNLQEMSKFQAAPEFVLDPTKLYLPLPTERPVRVYFVHEGAAYRNQLGVSIVDAGHGRDGASKLQDPLDGGKLIFPNASYKNPPDGLSPGGPLNRGDFVQIGNLPAGKQLDFFLVSNGASGGTGVLRNFKEFNSDGVQHVVAAYFSKDYPGYVLIGFEDIVGGGDLDYNDCLFIVDIGVDISINEGDLPH